MSNSTLTQPLFESPQDLQIMQRLRVSTPVSQNYIDPTFASWENVSATTMTVGAADGPMEGPTIAITTDGAGTNAIVHSNDAGPFVAIPPLETHGLFGFFAKCSDWTRVNTIHMRLAQGVVGNWFNYVDFTPQSAYDMFRNDTWQWFPVIRQTFPDCTTAGTYSWDAANDGVLFSVSDNGNGPVTVTLGSFFYLDTHCGPRGGVSVFFDKGYASAEESIYYALDHGVGVSIAIMPEKVGTNGYLNLSQLRIFYLMGAEICGTTSRDLTKMSRSDRLGELARTKRWLYSHNFVNGADMFVYPDGNGRSGVFDAWTEFDVMRHYTCARTTQILPGVTTPAFHWTLPCFRVTTQLPAALAGYVTYANSAPGSCMYFAFRGFDGDTLDTNPYVGTDFKTFINLCDSDKSCPPLAMITQPGCDTPILTLEDLEGPLKLVVDDANANTVVDVLEITHSTTPGPAGDGIGTGFEFKSEDDLGNIDEVGRINALWTDVTHGSQNARMDLTAGGATAGTGISFDELGKTVIGSMASPAAKGTLHVHTAASGVATANTNYDDLVVEGSGVSGLSFLTPANQGAFIVWGDPADDDIGQIGYSHVSDAMSFTAAAQTNMYVTGSGVAMGLNVNSNRLHVRETAAPDNAILDVLRVDYITSTATHGAAGIGAGIALYTEDSANNVDEVGRFQASLTNATHGAQTARVDITALGAAAGTGITVRNTGAVTVGTPISTLLGDGTLHVHTANCGTVTAWTSADELVLESGGSGGMSILTPDSIASRIAFGSPTSNNGAFVNWKYDDGILNIGTNKLGGEIQFMTAAATDAMRLTSGGALAIGATSATAGYLLDVNGYINTVVTGDQQTYPSVNVRQYPTAHLSHVSGAFDEDIYNDVGPSTHLWTAGSFTTVGAVTIEAFSLFFKSVGTTNDTGTLTAWIYTDNAGVPNTAGAATATAQATHRYGNISAGYSGKVFSLSAPVALGAATKYWIVTKQSAAPAGNTIMQRVEATGTANWCNGGTGAAAAWDPAQDSKYIDFVLYGRTYTPLVVKNSSDTIPAAIAAGNNAIAAYTFMGHAIVGSSETGYGIYGQSNNGYAGYFSSAYNTAVYGISTEAQGVVGISTNSSGVRGESTNQYGVIGTSTSSYGGYFTSTSGTGCCGISGSSYGGYFTAGTGYGIYGETTGVGGLAGFLSINPATTNTVDEVLRLRRATSVGAGNGIGAALTYHLEHTGGNFEEACKVCALLTNATDGAEESALAFYTRTGGAATAEVVRIGSGGELSVDCNAAAETSYGLYVDRDANSASRAWSAKFDCDNVGAGTLVGGLDLSSFAAAEPLLHVPVDAGAIGAHYGRVAVYVAGIGVKYIELFEAA